MANGDTKRASDVAKDLSSVPDDAGSSAVQQETRFADISLEREIKREALVTLKQNNKERLKYAERIFAFTICWAIAIILIVVFSGWKYSPFHFYLSDSVLITLITTTTVNFFGFFLLVVKYLFNPEKST